MHPEVVRNLYPNPELLRVEGIGEPTGAMEEPALWLPYSPQIEEALESEGYAKVEQFTGVEELKYGKSRRDHSTWTLDRAVLLASSEGDIAIVSRGRGSNCLFRQIWVRPNESVEGLA